MRDSSLTPGMTGLLDCMFCVTLNEAKHLCLPRVLLHSQYHAR